EYESELIDAIFRQLFQVEILQFVDAVANEQNLVHLVHAVFVLEGNNLGRPGVGTDKNDLLIGKPPRRFDADARLACSIGSIVFHPELPVTSSDKDSAGWAQFDLLPL